jgi:hypothetical protein
MHREIITCIGKLLLRSSISYFIWQDLIDNLYIYIYMYIYIDVIPFSFVANSFFLLLPTVNTLFHFKYILFINTLAVDT